MSQPAAARHLVIIPAAGSSRRMAQLTRTRPKSLLPVAGRPLLYWGLEALAAQGFRRAVIVTGYHGELLERTVGRRHGRLQIEYARNRDYATTEHGWSVYQAAATWRAHGGPALLVDADNLYDPAMLSRLLAAEREDLIAVDSAFDTGACDEELVLGERGEVTGLVRGRSAAVAPLAGAFVGVNRFSAAFCETLFSAMAALFEAEGRGFKYERILDRLVRSESLSAGYLDCAGLQWLNLNHEADLERAAPLAARMNPQA